MRHRIHMGVLMPVLAVVGLLSAVLSIGLGPVSVPPGRVVAILTHALPGMERLIVPNWPAVDNTIVLMLRLPRVLLGLVVGASLAVTGVAMQALVRNRLADPFVLGVSSGASVTATLGMLFGAFSFLGVYALSISAFLGAVATILLVFLVARVRGRVQITQLLLTGVVISMALDGVVRIITLSAPNALGLHSAGFWMAGSLAGAKWGYLGLPAAVLAVCIGALLLLHRRLDLLLLGEESAGALGVDVRRTQALLVLLCSAMAGAAVAVSGTIGFIGLVVPHFARLLVGSTHRRVLPVAALLGGILVVWADVAARLLIAPEELPVGVLTALLGGPLFLLLLRRDASRS